MNVEAVDVGKGIAVVRAPACAEYQVDGVGNTVGLVVECGIVNGGVAFQELQVNLYIVADGVFDGLLHSQLHVLLVLGRSIYRNVKVYGPFGYGIAKLFLSLCSIRIACSDIACTTWLD